MKVPAKPPAWQDTFGAYLADHGPGALRTVLQPMDDGDYPPWDRLRYRTPPEGLDHVVWWAAIKLRRQLNLRPIALLDQGQAPFQYVLTDQLLRRCEDVTRRSSGQIASPEVVTTRGERDRYVVSSLIEEAITSSQLEGASTTRRVAKEMIRSGRRPVTHGERMIANNYRAMQRVQELRDARLTPEVVRELHRIVTEGTLDDPADAGRVQTPDEVRIGVWGDGEQLLYSPPPAAELEERLNALCAFANGEDSSSAYIPPVLRAIIVHFMFGYDHYFVDGNGRTARALFYWSMLNQGYWLIEYVTISKILRAAPARYARSFLLTEDDDGDLTHFLLHHTEVLVRALDELTTYLGRKAQQLRDMKQALHAAANDYNHRQLAVLERAHEEPLTEFTATSHGSSHVVTGETARHDLQDLERRGLLIRSKRGKAFVWTAAPDLGTRLGFTD